MSVEFKISKEFEKEAEKLAKCTRKMMDQADEKIISLLDKAKKEEWYTGPSVIIEELMFDYCLNKSQRSWSNYCGSHSYLEEDSFLE